MALDDEVKSNVLISTRKEEKRPVQFMTIGRNHEVIDIRWVFSVALKLKCNQRNFWEGFCFADIRRLTSENWRLYWYDISYKLRFYGICIFPHLKTRVDVNYNAFKSCTKSSMLLAKIIRSCVVNRTFDCEE